MLVKAYIPFDIISVIFALTAFALMTTVAILMQKNRRITRYSALLPLFMLFLCVLRMALPFTLRNSFEIEISDATCKWLSVSIGKMLHFFATELFRINVFSSVLKVRIETLCVIFSLAVSFVLIVIYIFKCKKSSRQIKQIISRAKRCDEAEALFFEKVAKGKKANIKIYRSSEVEVPFLHGIFKGSIILPNISFTDDELCGIITHEWKHFKSWHMLIKILSKTVVCLMWWNPFVYLWQNSVSLALEMHCDYAGVTENGGKEARAYVSGIAKVSRNGRFIEEHEMAGQALVKKECELETRLKAISNYKKPTKREKLMNVALCAVMVLVFAASYSFSIYLKSDPNTAPKLGGYDASQPNKPFQAQYEQYIQEDADGRFWLWIDGLCMAEVSEDSSLLKYFKRSDGLVRYYDE